MESFGERFGAAVRWHREARGWSQELLAHQAGLNRSYVGEIERAAAMPSLATAAKVAQALELPLSALISRPPPWLELPHRDRLMAIDG